MRRCSLRTGPTGSRRLLAVVLLAGMLWPAAGLGLPVAIGHARTGGVGSVGLPGTAPDGPRTTVSGSPTPLAGITLTAPGADPTALSLTWTPTTSITFSDYVVQYSTAGATGPWQTAGTITSQSTTTFGATGLSPGRPYWWQVAETDSVFGTQYSNVLNVTQPTLAYLTSVALTASDVQLNWTNNASYGGILTFSAYQVLESISGSTPSVVATVTDVGTPTTTVTGLSSGTSYLFFVNTSDCLGGCTGAGSATPWSLSNPVTVGTPLPLAVTVTATRPVIDVGQLDLFTCTPAGGRQPFSFTWDLGNGTFSPGPESVSTSFASAGPSTVTCRAQDATHSQATSAITVSVAGDPAVSLRLNRTAAEPGLMTDFNCTPSAGVSPYSVVWAFGDGTQATTAEATHAYAAPANFTATCTALDATGTAASGRVVLPVLPGVTVAVTANSSDAAPGSNLTFSAAAVNGSGIYVAYDWAFADGATAQSAEPSASHAFSAAGTYAVSVSVTDTFGGVGVGRTTVGISNLTVTVASLPAHLTTGVALAFTATASGGAGAPYVFTWRFGDGTGGTGTSVSHAFASPGQYSPTLTVTDRLGASRVVALATVAVTAPPPPAPLFSPLLLLALAIGIAAVAAGLLEVRHRRQADREFSAVAGRVPAAGPARLVGGRRVCRLCGHSNLAIRESCEACGASLRRTP
jgi:PKD repeat protein